MLDIETIESLRIENAFIVLGVIQQKLLEYAKDDDTLKVDEEYEGIFQNAECDVIDEEAKGNSAEKYKDGQCINIDID